MAEEFEKEMQLLVDSYRCEWKQVVDSPELQKRFSHFVNAPGEKDPAIQFEQMRDQKKAVDWK
jgi:nitrite reductase (NADH) large subunit